MVIADSRRPIKYRQGHIPRAVNLRTSRIFDKGTLELLPIERLAGIIGDAGIDTDTAVLVCDDRDGQNEAMLGWTLELLGHPRVKLLSNFLGRWAKENRPISYRPTTPEPRTLRAKLTPDMRATHEQISNGSGVKLVDLRSIDEFEGKSSDGPKSIHLPGAVSLPWTSLLCEDDELLRELPQLEALVRALWLCQVDHIVASCNYGPRPTIGYAPLQHTAL